MSSYSDYSSFESDSDFEEDRVNGPTEFRTENGAVTLGTTRDARVDLFYKTIRGLSETKLREYLRDSWALSPQDTLRLIFFIRDIRGKGKGEKKIFQQSFSWLMDTHPEAVRHSSKHIPFYGCYKDWMEIFLGTRYEKSMLKAFAKQLKDDAVLVRSTFSEDPEVDEIGETKEDETVGSDKAKTVTKKKRKGLWTYIWGSSKVQSDKGKEEQSPEGTEKDPDTPRTEHVSISLAWKWAPTENTHYDKGKYKGTVGKLCTYLGMSKKEYRKTCTLMRAHLGVVEGFMCGKKWDEIDFSKVPSRAMHIYKKAYAKHQPERFDKFLEDVTKGEAKMNTGTLHPHEIVGQYFSGGYCGGCGVEKKKDVEAQWVSFVKGLEKAGVSFDQSIAVVDTSRSMTMSDGLPRKVAYSLGLVLAHFCKGPFHNKWIEFSESAKFHKFPEGSLHAKLSSIQAIVQSTNLQSVFDLILNTYTIFDVPENKQIKRIFIFTDGQWDQMTSNSSLTNFQAVEQKYAAAGYKRPQLIFWNVRANTIDFPTEHDTPDTALVSGFSSDLLGLFLDGGDLNPLILVLKAINDERYERITL